MDTNGALIQTVISNVDSDHDLFNFNVARMHEDHTDMFDLTTGRVLHCQIIRRHADSFDNDDLLRDDDIISFNIHHSAFDGGSISIFLRDLSVAYESDAALPIDDHTLQYIDYSAHERQLDMTASDEFWRAQLDGYDLERRLALPVDRHRLSDNERSGRAWVGQFTFDDDLSRSFLSYASAHNVTPFQLGLATFYAYLFKLSGGQQDLCIGSINANRYRAELRDMIGMFVATLPYRIQLDRNGPFEQLVGQVRDQCLSILEHSHYPLQQIIGSHHTPTFLETMFDYITMNTSTEQVNLGSTVLQSMSVDQPEHIAKFDMMVTFVHNSASGISCSLVCSQDLFDDTTVQILTDRFSCLLHQLFNSAVFSAEKQPLHQLSLILPREQLLIDTMKNNDCDRPPSTDQSISQVFCEKASSYSQKVAVDLDEQSMTYSELLFYAQRLAVVLIDTYVVKEGDIICQCVERSLSMVVGIMAIEMVGAVYCPLSPQDPLHRLHTLIEQTHCRLILVHAFTREMFDDHHTTLDIDLVLNMNDIVSDNDRDRLSHIAVTDDSIAYVIFTSGSTGTPKAVQVRHRNFLEAIRSLVEVGTFSENDTVAQIVRCSFDIHVEDIIGTLIVGGTLVMLHPGGPMDFEYLGQVLVEHRITYIHAVPTLLTAFFIYLEQNHKTYAAASLRSVCCIGEPFPVKLIDVLMKSVEKTCRVWNLYGPAETTLVATYHDVVLTSEMKNIPIGRLLPGYRCVIVDEFSQPVTFGQEGELLIGGVGVFAGYLGRDDLTEKALVDIDGQLFYRTGDLVRLDSDDLLYYVSRKDHQIKLRGQRLEPGEIERCVLETSPLITCCVVVKWGDDHLVAYVQSEDVSEEELRKHCQCNLPSYMVPSVFIVLKQLPLNANGKVDRKLLPIPIFSASTTLSDDDCGSLTPLEKALAAIFARAFHVDSPNVNASFGQLGGTSIDAIFALSLIREEVYRNMEIGLLFENPSVRQLACALQPLLVIKGDENEEEKEVERTEDEHRPSPSLFIEAVGIIFLVCQWLCPILMAYCSPYRFSCLLVPVSHLLSYVVCQRLLFWSKEESKCTDTLYSWRYYRWLFLERLWSINNSYWLQHLLGTPFYNSYLRLCGARIGRGVHIYSTWIDTPWLLDVGESTFIDSGTIVSSISYHDQAYELQPISIGSHCSIGVRCVLYGEVKMQANVHTEPMSVVTGCHSSTNRHASIKDRSFAWHQTAYQLVCLLCLASIHIALLVVTSLVYEFFVALSMPHPVALALSWLIWSITGLSIVLLSLKFIVGPLSPGRYPVNCYTFLHKLWLRQLIISSFHHSYEVLSSFNEISNVLLHWLGAHIEHDVKLAEFQPVLQFPSNLLKIERSVTTFAGVTLAPFEVTSAGDCCVDTITLGSGTNLGNVCTLLPGVRLAPNTIVGNLTRVTRETQCSTANTVLLGIPSRQMPFVMPDLTASAKDVSFLVFPFLHALMANCSVFLFGKILFISTYSFLPAIIAPFVQVTIACVAYHCLVALMGTKSALTYSETITHAHQFISTIMCHLNVFVGPFLSQTQYLVILLRALGARIGRDVTLPNIGCLTDPHLVTVGDHVRLHAGASLQSHTFEQRVFKLAPVSVNHSSVLMSYSNVLAGSTLQGRNRLLPLTLVMKNDQLAVNTVWSGVPARQVV